MDNISMCSGRISETTIDRERGKLTQGTEDELTLMRLRRMSRIIMSKYERHPFEARKLYRSNIVRFLESHLMHSSEKVRYLALELLCCTIPRLANKTDSLLKPLLPKIFQYLRTEEGKDMNLAALHFLRGFFRHSKSLSGFIENYVRFGIENSDPGIQICCCLGLNIVYDQDIGNSLFSCLIIPITNLLIQRNQHLIRTAYRALRHIHNVIGEDRFFDLISSALPEAKWMYRNLYYFEESDSFFSTNDNNCSTLVSAYQIKRRVLNLNKDFGIFDPVLLDQIQETRNCERARVVCNFSDVFKQISWTEEELYPHLMDFLKLVHSFICDSNRLIQITGFKILKGLINKMGFAISPHISWIANILREELISANSKVVNMVKRVLHKLMRNVHPMTIMWELLHTRDASLKEAVLLLIQEKLSCFPYYEFDMIALCSHLGQSVEDKNSNLAKSSKDCIILLLDIMRDCPSYGIRTEAVRVLLRNHKLNRETLKDIGVLGNNIEVNYQEEFESYSDEETTDIDTASIPTGSMSTVAMTQRSMSTVCESEIKCDEARSDDDPANSCEINCKSISSDIPENIELINEELGVEAENSKKRLPSPRNAETPMNWQINLWQTRTNSVAESSDTSSIKESIASPETDAGSSRGFSRGNPELDIPKQYWNPLVKPGGSKCLHTRREEKVDCPNHNFVSNFQDGELAIRKDNEFPDNSFLQDEPEDSHSSNVVLAETADVLPKFHSENKSINNFTTFSIKKDVKCSSDSEMHYLQDNKAGGDTLAFLENNSNLTEKLETEIDSRFISESYEQNGIEVDVLDKNVFNFNILQVEQHENNHDTEESDCIEREDKTHETNAMISKMRGKSLQMDQYSTPQKVKKYDLSSFAKHTNSKTRSSKTPSEFLNNAYKAQNKLHLQKFVDSNIYEQILGEAETSTKEFTNDKKFKIPKVKKRFRVKEADAGKMVPHLEKDNIEFSDNLEGSVPMDQFSDINMSPAELKSQAEVFVPCSNNFEEIEMPFLPTTKELPRTPVEPKKSSSFPTEIKPSKRNKRNFDRENKSIIKERTLEEKDISASVSDTQCEGSDKNSKKFIDRPPAANRTEVITCMAGKNNSPSKWGGCQWKRDLEYAAKAARCSWADKFENVVKSMKPLPIGTAEIEMKKAIDDLYGKSWQNKEDAMLNVIRLAKHHPEVVQENTNKIVLSLSNEIKNFRQSVAGKAILTTGHLYEIMGKHFENKIRLIVAALLAKSGNRTLAAYFRLVIKGLFKIIDSTSPQKAVTAFIHQGSKHPNKAARETAAQFIAVLTERLGPEHSLTSSLSNPMLNCAATFASDSSALTRYCGKRMFKVFMENPEVEKLKDYQILINTLQSLGNVLAQIKEKGIREEILPINVID